MGSLLLSVALLTSVALLAVRAAVVGGAAGRAAVAGLLLLGLGLLAQDGGRATAPPAAPAARARPAADTATPAPAWPDDGAVDVPVASTGCGRTPATAPGTTAQGSVAVAPATDQGFATRTYWVHVPTGYAPSRPTALVLVFHGGGGSALGTVRGSGISPLADQHGFLAVYPQGLAYDELGAGYTTWAATGPLDSVGNGVDDRLFVSNLLDALQRRYCVDPARIYATGFSAGGGMTAFLTCGLTGRIAAFAPMSGDAYQFKGGCPRPHPTSILQFHGDKIGRIAPDGTINEYPVPTPGAGPFMLAVAPDGAVWFTEDYTTRIGRVSPAGVVTELGLPDPNSSAAGIALGPDGNLWVTAYPGVIDRVTPGGAMTQFTLPGGTSVPFAIAAGPDGNLWFTYDGEATGQDANRLGRITPAGVVTIFLLPTRFSNVDAIAAGPDGNVWFADYANQRLGRITPGGAIAEYAVAGPYNDLNDLALGRDGALWFTEQDGALGRLTPGGALSRVALPTPNSQPDGIVAGPGETLWFTDLGSDQIGRLAL